jgi:hypothetical protein
VAAVVEVRNLQCVAERLDPENRQQIRLGGADLVARFNEQTLGRDLDRALENLRLDVQRM